MFVNSQKANSMLPEKAVIDKNGANGAALDT